MNRQQKEVQQAFLNSEKDVLKKLERNYSDAINEIETRIAILQGRKDADLQHVIYQIEYQKALKEQVNTILEQLHNNNFETLSEYLTASYEDGFIGTLYDLQGQGIPLMFPIDQEQIVAAIQHETKLSESLYAALGKDTKVLSKQIAGEISRGISNSAMYSEMARNISSYCGISKNKAMRIARTEAHRIQCKATADVQRKAKEKGADVVKQWDASLDGKTRETHAKLDGQIRELEEPFEVYGMKAMQPGGFGIASEDCNCRCALLQRARWALGNEYTKWSPDAPVLIDDNGTTQLLQVKAKDFTEFKGYYKDITGQMTMNLENSGANRVRSSVPKINDLLTKEKSLRTKDNGEYGVDWKIVKSKEYTKRFNNISDNEKANILAAQRSRNALANRTGKNTEELYAISLTKGTDVSSITNQHFPFGVQRTEKFTNDVIRAEENGEIVMFIHNHPKGFPPSIVDLNELLNHKNAVGITVGHDGSIYYYTKPNKKIEVFDEMVAKRKNKMYNDIVLEEKTIEELSKQFGFKFMKL